MIQELTDSQNVQNLANLRDFLEELYTTVCSNENKTVSSGSTQINNTICYKISILGTYIPNVLSNISSQSMEDLFKIYGSPPQPPIGGPDNPAPGILTSTQDYVMLLQLYIAGSNLSIVSTGDSPIWKQDVSGVYDFCENIDKSTSNIIGYSMSLYNIIRTSLQHFHDQVLNSKSITNGEMHDVTSYEIIPFINAEQFTPFRDENTQSNRSISFISPDNVGISNEKWSKSYNTKIEGMSDYYAEYISENCTIGTVSGNNICNGLPQPIDFYSSYVTTTYTDFNKPGQFGLDSFVPKFANINNFRVLLIGGCGGGGGAARGKNNNNGHDQRGGGGGGGGGGGITYSAKYPYANNYVITVGAKGSGGLGGRDGTSGGSSNLYERQSQSIITANGGYGGKSGRIANGNQGGSDFEDIGNQGTGGAGGSGNTENGNSGKGGKVQTATGGDSGSSNEWSTSSETTVLPLYGGNGGNAPTTGTNNGEKTIGNSGSDGANGFIRVYWIP